jgi:hypothetical protein
MNEQTVLEEIKDWGYYLLPKAHPESLGHPEILFVIGNRQTGGHYNPKSIRLRLLQGNGCWDWTLLRLKVFTRKTCQICPGSVILQDWGDERVEFYTFGGSLEIVTFPGEMVCSLRSSAPILAVNRSPSNALDQLAFEVKALLEEHWVKWEFDDRDFVRRLSSTDPLQLYLATLHSMFRRFEQYRALPLEYSDLYQALLREREWLIGADQWPTNPSSLDELLSRDNDHIRQVMQEMGSARVDHLQISHSKRR